jgi:hypothetical protein
MVDDLDIYWAAKPIIDQHGADAAPPATPTSF